MTDRAAARLLLLLLLFVIVLVFPARPAVAQEGVTATLSPAAIPLAPGATARGTLVVSNGGAAPVTVTVATVPSDPSVRVTMAREGSTVASKSSDVLPFEVQRAAEGTGQDTTVGFVVTYAAVDAEPGAATRATVATLAVKAVANPDLIEAKIETSFTNINENRPRTAALVLKNLREAPVTVTALTIAAPPDVAFQVECPEGEPMKVSGGERVRFDACRLELGPRAHVVLSIALEADDALAPGPRDALFEVEAESGNPPVTGEVVATLSFTADVFAESELLKAVGVSLFLLLPGMIIAVTAWFLVARASPWKNAAGLKDPPDLLTTGVVGVAVSLVVAGVYPALTKRFIPGEERDYLDAYGFKDFYYVFAYSFAIAVAIWIGACLLSGAISLGRWLFVPLPGDEARDLLRKVCLRSALSGRASFPLVTAGGKAGVVLDDRGSGKALVAPVVVVHPKGAAEDDVRRGMSARVDARGPGARLRLLWAVWRALRKGEVEVQFEPGMVPAVALVDSPPTGAQKRAIVKVGA